MLHLKKVLVCYLVFFFVWVWALNVSHYTVAFGFGCFLCLGCFLVVVCVWAECLCHTLYMASMYRSVSVDVDGCCCFVVVGYFLGLGV